MIVTEKNGTIPQGRYLPTEFSYSEDKKLQAIFIQDIPWFVAADVCEVLGLSHTHKAVVKLDEDEKLIGKVFRGGQNRESWLVNESGLYNLIFRSTKPEAKKFRRWVTTEVLPALRKNGNYSLTKTHTPGSAFPGVYRFTSTQMLEIIKTINQRPVNKSDVMGLLLNGGTI